MKHSKNLPLLFLSPPPLTPGPASFMIHCIAMQFCFEEFYFYGSLRDLIGTLYNGSIFFPSFTLYSITVPWFLWWLYGYWAVQTNQALSPIAVFLRIPKQSSRAERLVMSVALHQESWLRSDRWSGAVLLASTQWQCSQYSSVPKRTHLVTPQLNFGNLQLSHK